MDRHLDTHEGRGLIDYLVHIQHHGAVDSYAGRNGVPTLDMTKPIAEQIAESDAFKAFADSLVKSGDTTTVTDDSGKRTYRGVDETTQKARVAMFTDADLDSISRLAGSLFSARHDKTAEAALRIATGEIPLVADQGEIFDLDVSRARALIQSAMVERQTNVTYQRAMGMERTTEEASMDAFEKANLEAIASARNRSAPRMA